MPYHYIPYNQQADPWMQLIQGLSNYLGGTEKQRQRRLLSEDIASLGQRNQYEQQLQQAMALRQYLMGLTPEQRAGYTGPSPQFPAFQQQPQLQSDLGMQMALSQLDPLKRLALTSKIEAERARKAYWSRTARTEKPTLSSSRLKLIEKKLKADPSFEGSPEHLRLLGVSMTKAETPEEKLKRLQALRKSAAGQYYGIEGGNLKPLYPKLFDYAEKEIAKLPMFQEKIDIIPQVSDIDIEGKGRTFGDLQYGQAPHPDLEEVWDTLSPEDKKKVQQAIDNGYSIQQILAAIGG